MIRRVRDSGAHAVLLPDESPDLHLWIDGHHFVHWGHGGETEVENLLLLCYRHHWMVHEGGWQLARVERGRLLAIPPSRGHRSWIRAPGNAAAG